MGGQLQLPYGIRSAHLQQHQQLGAQRVALEVQPEAFLRSPAEEGRVQVVGANHSESGEQ